MTIYEVLGTRPVAPVISNWLQEEIIESDSGPNSYLSNFNSLVPQFFMPFDDDRNVMTQKSLSHQRRITDWLAGYKKYPDLRVDDFYTAKLSFNSLMRVSGAFRKQCMLMSANVQDYTKMRHEQGPAGIDIHETVKVELESAVPEVDDPDPEFRVDYLIERSLDTVTRDIELQRFLHDWAADKRLQPGEPLSSQGQEPVEAMLEVQDLYVGLAVVQMAVAATFRGNDPAKIPLLYPMNISDNPGVIYPFAA